jgi:serine phosphatase RsbU (regulator of sigma subunit)
MHTHRPLRYSRNTLLRSAFTPPEACVRFAVETRNAIDLTMRGGDIFEVHLRSDGSAALLIADVSSKGALSIVHTEMMRRTFRMCASTERSPAVMMAMLNRLRFDGPPPTANVTFASAIIVAIERSTMICRYASAGHDIGLLFRDRAHRHLAPTGPVLGVIPDAVYTDCIEPFGNRDFLVLATDGFTECRDNTNQSRQFGTSGIARAVSDTALHSGATLSRALALSIDDFTAGNYRDDATLAVIVRGDRSGTVA